MSPRHVTWWHLLVLQHGWDYTAMWAQASGSQGRTDICVSTQWVFTPGWIGDVVPKQGGVSLLAPFVWTYMNITIAPWCGTKQRSRWSQLDSVPDLERFICSENTTKKPTRNQNKKASHVLPGNRSMVRRDNIVSYLSRNNKLTGHSFSCCRNDSVPQCKAQPSPMKPWPDLQ